MAKARRIRRCFHCGAILQSKNPKEPGYILESTINNNKPDALLYCNACYNKVKALNYSELDNNVDEDVLKILKDAVATDALIIWVVDLFNFNGTLNENIVKRVKKLNVIVVGTKRDLFSKSIKNEVFESYLKERFMEVGITPMSIKIFGNESSIDTQACLKAINNARKGHDVYMVGELLSGKTSIINKTLKNFENKSRWTISMEAYPDTKVKVLSIPLSNSSFFYELPSLSLTNSVYSKVEKDVQKLLIPKDKIKVVNKSLSKDESIIVGNFVTFTLVKGKTTSVKFFSSDNVEMKKVKNNQVDSVYEENYKKRNIRPYSENFFDFNDYDLFEYDMEKDNLIHDIAVEGLGWFSFVAKGQTFRIQIPKGVAIKECLGKIR